MDRSVAQGGRPDSDTSPSPDPETSRWPDPRAASWISILVGLLLALGAMAAALLAR